ncbi:UvrABC system protein C [Thermogemmatispora aurantia]|jgi:excinuclease ABC subunit C|uniref:UvrABC system protein C n=1 Tax=Thermogemmatispora aurantia TaxID=2045279 RepID=A0A5J4K0E4_9CHLR|nr:excinuclease ABC subunit UvrC [Thermogemmatispora aurantia]GER82604.1 UvrABC system protein C [Thermogemmatispora aurantia]
MNDKIRSVLNSLPSKPGIYLMKDAQGQIIYVGKAVSLHQRVRSYFQESADLSPKNRSMVARVDDIEYVVVENEIEALVLESNYIKQYRPKYNVLLRDDKNYPYIKVALSEDFPRVYRVRNYQRDGNRYFGPYTSSAAVDATLDLLNKLFPFRTCRYDGSAWAPPRDGQAPAGWKPKYLNRPCTQYYIHRCLAPCVGYVTREDYDAIIEQVILFLEGKHEEVLKQLEARMHEAAEALNFEEAARLRDRIRAVEHILEKQRIINTEGQEDQDVIALASAEDETCAQVFFFRGGKLIGREYFILQGTRDSSPGEIMSSFLQQFYESAPHIPAEIVLEVEPDDRDMLQAWLRSRRGKAITLSVPRRGEKRSLIELVKQNAQEVLEQQRIKWLSDSQKTQLALEELQTALNLAAPPYRIECYDISNIQGSSAVGAMVVFEAGRPKPAEYRRFRIKSIEGANDPASHQEILRRRFRREPVPTRDVADASALNSNVDDGRAGVENAEGQAAAFSHDWPLPDLIVIDGGKAQLNAALQVLQELHVEVPIIGLAKEEGSHSRLPTAEAIYLPRTAEPLLLPRTSQGLYLLQRIRDEAHRFGITYHRKLRSQRTFRSQLDEIPGIGPRRKQALLKHFGSVQAIREASVEELAAVEGMTRAAAEKVKEYIGRS